MRANKSVLQNQYEQIPPRAHSTQRGKKISLPAELSKRRDPVYGGRLSLEEEDQYDLKNWIQNV